jgi:hypothetical protein
MGALFSKPKQPSMPAMIQYVPQAVDTYDQEESKAKAQEEAEKQRRAANAARGPASTILTGGMGVLEEAPIKRKKLFGE